MQAGNGSLGQKDRDAIAVRARRPEYGPTLVANTQHLGRNIFAGSSDKAGAFTRDAPDPKVPGDPGTPPSFTGAANSSVERRVSANQTVRVDADGAAIFGNGSTSIFATISQITTICGRAQT